MKTKVYAYLHTHWDREWYRDKEDFNLRLLKVFDIVLDELENKKAPCFYFDGQISALLDYLKYRSEKKDLIKKLIKEKKLFIGPYFVSADSFLVSYASMLKNLDFGLEISKSFDAKDFIGYMADIFGISKSAFLALGEKNIDKALIWRGVNPLKINNNSDFIFQNIKTTWLAQGYFNDFLFADIPSEKKAQNIENCLNKIKKFSYVILLPIGADHLGILRDSKKVVCEINSYLKNYEITLASPFEYFKNVNFKNIIPKNIQKTSHIEFLDNSDTYILQGCYSSRIYQKVKNRILENNLSRKAEVLNYFLNYNYQKNIDFAYKTLIKCHAHDGICGCSIDSVHRMIDSRQEKSENIINSVLKNIIADFKKEKNLQGKTKDKIGIFNLSNTENLNVVKIKAPYKIKNAQVISKERTFEDDIYYDIYKIPVTEQITNIYTQLVEIENTKKFSFSIQEIKKPANKVKITPESIENDFIKLEIKDGEIKIIDKKTKNKEAVFELTDIKDLGDSYNFAPEGEIQKLKLLKTKIIKQGLIQSTLRLYFKNIQVDVVLNNYSKFLKFNSTIDNKKKNHKIQAVFKLQENITSTIAQDAYGIIEREIDFDYKMQDFMPAQRPVEIKTNSYPMQNFVNFKNNSILTKGLSEYEVYKNELRICLLRAFLTISNPKNKARFIPAGPDLKTVDSQCLFKTKQEFAFLFGNYKDCFNFLDEFFENYLTFDCEINKNLKIDEIEFDEELSRGKNFYFYCINQDKKIIFKYD